MAATEKGQEMSVYLLFIRNSPLPIQDLIIIDTYKYVSNQNKGLLTGMEKQSKNSQNFPNYAEVYSSNRFFVIGMKQQDGKGKN